jgi:adenylate cyclase
LRTLSRSEFANEAGASVEVVDRLVESGTIRPIAAGTFDPRDEAVASTAQAMLDAGIPLEDLAWSLADGRFGIRSVRHIFSEPAPRTAAPYREIAATLGEAGQLLPAVYAALGLPEPEPDDHPRVDEAEIVASFVRLWGLVDPTGEAPVRVARLVGDSLRRLAEGWLDVWDEVARPDPTTQGAPTVGERGRPADPTDPEQNPSIAMADVGRRLVALVHERQVETTLNARIIAAIEGVLGDAGRLPPRSSRPPAVAFVDLSGFTTLTEERGDEAAAQMAAALMRLAETSARPAGGRVVKELGDGVLLRFPDAERALAVVGAIHAAVEPAGLPAAHAGIAAGPVIVRDGDVFGRTVNLAARLASAASAGETLVEEGVVVALPTGRAAFDPVGRVALPGMPQPVAVWRVRRSSPVLPTGAQD